MDRSLARNLLRQDTTAAMGVKAKRLKAGWDEAYLLKLLAGSWRVGTVARDAAQLVR